MTNLPTYDEQTHYEDVIMGTMASQITSLTIVYSTVYSGADQRKHQSSASLVFVWGIHRRPVNSPHKGPVTRKMFRFDDVIMTLTMTNQPSRAASSLVLLFHLPAYISMVTSNFIFDNIPCARKDVYNYAHTKLWFCTWRQRSYLGRKKHDETTPLSLAGAVSCARHASLLL